MKLKYRIGGLLAAAVVLSIFAIIRPVGHQVLSRNVATQEGGWGPKVSIVGEELPRRQLVVDSTHSCDCGKSAADPLDYTLPENVVETLRGISSQMDHTLARSSEDRLNIHKYGPDQVYETEADLPIWQQFQNGITRYKLYQEGPVLESYLRDLRDLDLVRVETMPESGTQLKLVYEFKDGGRAMFKPKKLPIEAEASIDQYTFDEFERFQAEIAAFHLDRILQFYRVPPVVGRYVNMTRDIRLKAPLDFRKTFYRSRVGNWCFYGRCDQFCEKPFASCGQGDLLEGSFASYLPSRTHAGRQSYNNPWAQSYSRRKRAVWMNNATYCQSVQRRAPYNRGRRLLDLMDLAAFDFLIGNLDRHSYHTFKKWASDSNIILYDNGRGFGRSRYDIMNLLTPITQCCLFRLSTLDKLLDLHTGETKLGAKLKQYLSRDAVQPLLTESHFQALDRRVKIILQTVHKCVVQNGGDYAKVIVNDGF